jgi:DMSO/TMAO reductase YedYZ molybdopterin-dependent catalytic subunit
MSFISRGFRGRRGTDAPAGRVPPGQYTTRDFPVLSAGPTPRIDLADWRLDVDGAVGAPRAWSWQELMALPADDVSVDIHCVTKWSKLDTSWRGVSLDLLLGEVGPSGGFVLAHSYGGYTTNLPLADLQGGRAWIAYEYDGQPLHPEHGGPARLLVPHLYLWKSAKWIRRIEVRDEDTSGFWERYGYHAYGDPWREQRYAGD